MGHVNNVMYTRYAESARIEWAQKIATFVDPAHGDEWRELWTPRSVGLILRSIKTDYKFPMTYPDHVTVLHKLRNAPDGRMDHFILDVIILSELHQRPAARCVEDIVVYDYQQGKKVPLKPFMVDMFHETFRLQEAAKKSNGENIRRLHERVEVLEKETWDRPDAKEDLGSAAP
ncbi:hypothetical protein P152DRAFT_454219 [Eremomyces bilateralis CBS 781.70]|uniref:Thioesterase/thiol ester dehydrase-isomerase n=1 Tax=Eremomyces bilateralis CBS 781.70 TaxID=1392243 RepID=A0A6G1GHS1_9PEZI|nr:uncharacterized protein P152DRAFT_454219 [Eremomyces bilateralis CBS 781.70]KAF1817647.1 hypothetical protein P152DRAFT_454219 [Eremomyces bilateralis CBS 781.70]